MIERPAHAILVERVFPFGNNDRRDAIADQIGQGAGLGHETIDTEDQRNARHRDRPNR